MTKYQPWLKMWVEWIDDPKMLSLSLAEQSAWWRLCTLGKKCGADGYLVKGSGTALSLEEITDAIRIRTKADRRDFDSMVEKMIKEESLHWHSDALVITHFTERQSKTTSVTPEAVRERVRLFRERKAGLPPKNPPKEKDIDIEERRGEVTSLQSVTSEPTLAKISTLFEQYCGLITPILAEKFKDFVENYSGPVEWIDLAFDEAVKYKKRRWDYIEAILCSWQEKGEPHGDSRSQSNDTHQRDPSTGKGFGEFKAIESGE